MNELFPGRKNDNSPGILPPLADRMRPKNISEMTGQEHLIGAEGPLKELYEKRDFSSMILWGPPGSGKTTLALMIADYADYNFKRISAVESGVKEVKSIIAEAGKLLAGGKKSLLFIDEIHRFNKAQQDALLHAVEKGIIILVGATTENPSFEVNSALLSRSQVYRLRQLEDSDIRQIIENALEKDEILSGENIEIPDMDFLIEISGGDARTALNSLELGVKFAREDGGKRIIDRNTLEKALQQKTARYDKQGDNHYDTISAFIKSMRGSDPDAALFWLAKMLEAGEDPKFIARRMVIFASEDIGNADPFALTHALSVFRAVEVIGLPECDLNLAHGVTYLATAPKSNATYKAIRAAQKDIKSGISVAVPMHIRNAPTKLMKKEGFGKGYKYPHDYPGHFVKEHYFPEDVNAKSYYRPEEIGREAKIKEIMQRFWPERK
jgi:putative ATPase